MLNGFELHVYNRCKMYSNLEKVFNLDPSIIPWDELSVSKYSIKNINNILVISKIFFWIKVIN